MPYDPQGNSLTHETDSNGDGTFDSAEEWTNDTDGHPLSRRIDSGDVDHSVDYPPPLAPSSATGTVVPACDTSPSSEGTPTAM